MRSRNALTWIGLAALAVAASCAQGSSDTSGPPVVATGDDAGFEDAGRESIDVDAGDDDSGGTPSGDDAAGPGPGDDGGGPGDDDAATGDDASTVVDAGHDAGHDSGAVSVVPTTCAEADQGYGCCVGNENYYCNQLDSVTSKKCTGGEVCGWSASKKYYDCVAAPGGTDPSGVHSIICK